MSTLAERIEEVIGAGFSQADLARAAGVTKGAVNQWRNGSIKSIKLDYAHGIEALTGYSATWLVTGKGNKKSSAPLNLTEVNVLPGPELRGKLPLISWVRAGDLCESPDVFHPGDAEEWIDCPVPHSPRSYCLRVSGDSMDGEGGYRDGEIIFVDPEVAATPGRDVIVRTPEGKTTFKRLKEDTEGLYLFGINGKKIIRIPPNTHICGVVIFSGFKR